MKICNNYEESLICLQTSKDSDELFLNFVKVYNSEPDIAKRQELETFMENRLLSLGYYIGRFREEYYFLSNMYPCKIVYDGDLYASAETAFQAAKVPKEERTRFLKLDGFLAKRAGKFVNLRKDWETVKVDVMRDILRYKFTENTKLKNLLLQTACYPIIHENHWGDTFWGVCRGEGQNMLGKLLMDLRKELRSST